MVEAFVPLREESPGSQELFVSKWQIYRKMVEANYLFHREAYGNLHRVLRHEVARPFRFLDIACGDASATVDAIRGTAVAHYHGIDLSETALAIARETLADIGCRVTLDCRDFFEALQDDPPAADVAWIGLSLHHLLTADKRRLMRAVRDIVGENGIFLIYEVARRDGESRTSWLSRWDAQAPTWTAYTPGEWEAVRAHVHASDFPETDSVYRALAVEAGFSRVRSLFVSPTDLLRMYAFQA